MSYVWADCDGGWRTEVAGRRHTWDVPLPPTQELPVGEANSPERSAWASAWVDRSAAIQRLMDDESNWHWTDLPTPEGGNSYWHDTAAETADNLERLRAAGFNVPQSAIDALREEAAEVAR
jgi:hypothetical protein